VSLEDGSPTRAKTVQALADARFDIVHALHARRGGACALPLARSRGVPCVLTLTGTDATHDVLQAEYGPATRATISGVDALVALRTSQLDELARAGVTVPMLTVVIPQGIDLTEEPGGIRGATRFDLRAEIGVGARDFVALLPGGLRPVKAQHVALAALEELARRAVPVHLVLAGPTLDSEYEALLRIRAGSSPYVHFVGTLAHADMGAALAASDVVLNSSESEGESNAILEAQWAGKLVLARRNRGNVALIQDDVDGRLFDTPAELAAMLEAARRDPAAASAVGARARERVRARADPALEAARHVALYRALMTDTETPEACRGEHV
jgi:glycosyltransferase involved in cell wall biosynthesis